jgi:hypothetical protein
MNPDELKAYVDGALSHHDNDQLLCLILLPILCAIGGWLGAYAKQKGTNLATKEDVEEITAKVESVKTSFGGQLESLKTNLDARRHYGQLRYEREIKVFEEVWQKMYHVNKAAVELQIHAVGPRTTSESPDKSDILRRFAGANVDLYECVWRNRPFYPEAIWKELNGLHNLYVTEGIKQVVDAPGEAGIEEWKTVGKKLQAIQDRLDQVCELIRARLKDFDSV